MGAQNPDLLKIPGAEPPLQKIADPPSGSRIKYPGPCFGTNGHPRRDTDVILRLSKSTIEDLSFYIDFVKELMDKMVVYDETVTLLWMLDLVLARMSILEEIRT